MNAGPTWAHTYFISPPHTHTYTFTLTMRDVPRLYADTMHFVKEI